MHGPVPPSAADAVDAPLDHPPISGRYFALVVLFSMNLLNYIDRYSFFAVGTKIQDDLNIHDDFWFGVLSVSFMVVYTIVTLFMGWMGDRSNRRRLLTIGVGVWSLATVGTAISRDFYHMFFWRALLGVGEATYGAIALPLLSDLFPARTRGRAIGLYYLALPLGGALGYGIGGWIGDHWSWRAAFCVVGFPGFLAAAAGLWLRDPGRGASEGFPQGGPNEKPSFRDYLALFKNRSFLFNTAGLAAVTFATGGYGVWAPKFYETVRGMTTAQAGAWIGGMTAGAGLFGIALGTFVSEVMLKYTRRAYLLTASIAVAIAIPFGTYGVLDPHRASSLATLFVAMVMLAAVLGPCNTVTANVVPANQRAAGCGLSIFLIHLFGDISSPLLMGYLSDLFGTPSAAGSFVGQFFAQIGAGPVDSKNLTVGMLSVVPVLVLGCGLFLYGSKYLVLDQARAQRTKLALGGAALESLDASVNRSAAGPGS
jgi:MFS family permease